MGNVLRPGFFLEKDTVFSLACRRCCSLSYIPCTTEFGGGADVLITPHCHFLNITPPLSCKNFCSLRFMPLPTANRYSSTNCHSPPSCIMANEPHRFLKSCHQPGCVQYDLPGTWPSGFLIIHLYILHTHAYMHLLCLNSKRLFEHLQCKVPSPMLELETQW